MTSQLRDLRRPRPAARLGLLLTVVALAAAGCGSSTGTTAKVNATRAASALSAGLAAQQAGRLDEAAERYAEVLQYEPKNKYALYDLAIIDAAQLNFGKAEEKYRVVLAIDPGYAPALFNLAILLKGKGDHNGAIGLYRRVITATPDDAAAHLNLGLLLRTTGKTAEGDAEVSRALQLNPELRDPAKATATSPSAVPSPSAKAPSGS